MTTLTLSMIVRDAALLLQSCLDSVRGVVQEMVIADTGSDDDTLAVAQRLGARTISIPWNNDFAAARNLCLAEVTSDWVLSLDADEILDSSAASQLPALIENTSVAAFQVTIRNYVLSLNDRVWDRSAKPNDSALPAARSYPAYVEHQNVRLFRRDPDIYFVGRVHESVGSRVLQTGKRLSEAPFFIHHFGLAADQETRTRKNIFYRELGLEKIREMPEDAQAHLELGLIELDNFGNLAEARSLFKRATKLNPKFALAWFFQGVTLLKLENPSEALRCMDEAERLGHRTALVAEMRGDAHYNAGRYPQAADCYETGLRREPINPSLESKLGLAIVRSGNMSRGMNRLNRAVASRPGASELHDRLVLTLVWLGRLEEAAEAAETKLHAVENPPSNDYLRSASLWAKTKNWSRAISILQRGIEHHPRSGDLQQGLQEATSAAAIPRMVSSAK